MISRRYEAVEAENATIPANVRYRELLAITRIHTGDFEGRTCRTDRELNSRAVIFVGISPSANEGMLDCEGENFRHREFQIRQCFCISRGGSRLAQAEDCIGASLGTLCE